MIESTLSWFESSHIPYVVLRNWEGLPRTLVGNDLDILVRPTDLQRVARGLRNAAEVNGWSTIQDLTRPYIRALKFASESAHEVLPEIIHIDLFTRANWRLFEYRSADDILAESLQSPTGIHHLPTADELFLTVTHHLLWTGELHKRKYVQQLERLDRAEIRRFAELLASTFGESTAGQVYRWSEEGGRMDRTLRRRARMSVIRRAMSRPLEALRLATQLVGDEVRTFVEPRGLLLSTHAPPEGPGVDAFVDWMATIWQYNHAVVRASPLQIHAGARTSRASVKRVAYGGCARRAQVAKRLHRLRRRGWIVLLLPEASDLLAVTTPDMTVDLTTLQGCHDAASCVVRQLASRQERIR